MTRRRPSAAAGFFAPLFEEETPADDQPRSARGHRPQGTGGMHAPLPARCGSGQPAAKRTRKSPQSHAIIFLRDRHRWVLANEDIEDNRKIQRTFAVTAGCFWLLFCRRVYKQARISAADVGCWLFFAAFNSDISLHCPVDAA